MFMKGWTASMHSMAGPPTMEPVSSNIGIALLQRRPLLTGQASRFPRTLEDAIGNRPFRVWQSAWAASAHCPVSVGMKMT